MALNLLNQLGDRNPQLFRELKGRLKPRNILIAVTVSLLGQLLLLINFSSKIPVVPSLKEYDTPLYSRYCTGNPLDLGSLNLLCVKNPGGSFDINWSLWWQDVFVWLSFFGIFALLVVGIYMLIADLSKEEQRGTLNFIRLSPQSSESIAIGKLLGVPSLLYLAGFLALPLHLTAGLSGQVSLIEILGYYGILGVACLCFYSFALLFGLVGNWLGNFQAWLGSGVVLAFLLLMAEAMQEGGSIVQGYTIDWVVLFNPSILVSYLTDGNFINGESLFPVSQLEQLRWFGMPIGASVWSLAAFMAINYGLWAYWVWQGLKRCFHNPSATLLSKQLSYWLTASFEAVILGFALNAELRGSYSAGLWDNFKQLLVLNLPLFLFLIAALCPHRQAMQDWARYRHQKRSSHKGGAMADLIWGENSPALVAVVLNVAIASAILLPWIVLGLGEYKVSALWGLVLNMGIILVCAAIAQLMLFMKMPKRSLWATAAVGGLILLPPVILGLLIIEPSENPGLWLFSAFPWAAVEHATGMAFFLPLIGQSLLMALLSLQLTRQLRQAGESSTKAMLSGRSSVAIH